MTCIQAFVLGSAFGGNFGGYSGCEKIYHFWGTHFEDFRDEMTWSLGLALNVWSIYNHCGKQYGGFSENQKCNYHMTEQVHSWVYIQNNNKNSNKLIKKKYMLPIIHNSIIYNYQEMETT